MKRTIKKIIIINTVPINGGDEALLQATLLGLYRRFHDVEINVLCNNPVLTQKYINFVNVDWDWELAFLKADYDEDGFRFKIKRKIRLFLKKSCGISFSSLTSMALASNREKRVLKLLKSSDLVLVGAGGYIHDFYSYKKRLESLIFMSGTLRKPYILFSQSVGPFWKDENYPQLRNVFKKAEKIILREECSLDHLKDIKYSCNNVEITNDVAFYLYPERGLKVNPYRHLKKIAVNFREWKYEYEGEELLFKATKLCRYLINRGYHLSFVSTCQGVKGYTDDSIMAEKVIAALDSKQQKACSLFSKKYSLDDLIKFLGEQDAYIGMRLHGAILSLIAGIPALNIGYEDKSYGIFKSLGLENYCFSYKEDMFVWQKETENFITNYPAYLLKIEPLLENAAKTVEKNFEFI